MASEKRNLPIAVFVLFTASLLILIFNVFKIPADAGPEYNFDKIFFYGSNIIFWFTAPYLLSLIIKKVIWKSEFKDSVGTKSIGMIEDLLIVLVYFVSFSILLLRLFTIEISAGLILLFFILLALSVYLRPRILALTKTGFISSVRPFKIGDNISFINHNGENAFTGKVLGFNRKSVQLKTDKNTLLILPQHLAADFAVENYHALEKEILCGIEISLSRNIPIDRVKRILTAAARQALTDSSTDAAAPPEALLTGISKDSADYKILFSYAIREPHSQESIKDLILCSAIDHLKKAGISFEHDANHNILEQVELFTNLDKDRLKELLSSSPAVLYRAGDVIIKQGDEGSSMFILSEGLLDVYIRTGNNEELKAGIITPGQFFGEMSLLTGEKRSATIKAGADSIVLEITKESMKKILDKKPDLIDRFGEIIAERQSSNLKIMDDYLNRKESFVQKIAARIKSFFNI